jgi:hypothetical protein
MEFQLQNSVPTLNITHKVNEMYLIVNQIEMKDEDRKKIIDALAVVHQEIAYTHIAKRELADTLFRLANIVYNDNKF